MGVAEVLAKLKQTNPGQVTAKVLSECEIGGKWVSIDAGGTVYRFKGHTLVHKLVELSLRFLEAGALHVSLHIDNPKTKQLLVKLAQRITNCTVNCKMKLLFY